SRSVRDLAPDHVRFFHDGDRLRELPLAGERVSEAVMRARDLAQSVAVAASVLETGQCLAVQTDRLCEMTVDALDLGAIAKGQAAAQRAAHVAAVPIDLLLHLYEQRASSDVPNLPQKLLAEEEGDQVLGI